MQPRQERGTSALVVAHPGHELRVYYWVEQHRPLYFCLTDGSGGIATSRLASTTRLLETLGATRGSIYGRYPDKDIYRFLLDGRVEIFANLAIELAQAFIAAGVSRVAGDAVEGFNPTHDVCRFIIDGAVAIVRTRTGCVLQNYDFVLDASPDACPESLRTESLKLDLDDAALDRKIGAALDYPEMREEVRAALARFGKSAFATEYLRPTTTRLMLDQFEHTPPAYELFGQMRVNQGRYDQAIRYREHVLPALKAIEEANRG